jgi:uncharacterized cupin superfamily protein
MRKPDNETTKRWLDPASLTPRVGSIYPAPFAAPVAGREKRARGDPLGLTQLGVNLVTLGPGSWSSQRHWHENEDDFIYVLEDEVSLVTDEGETVLRPGMAAGFQRALATAIISSIADLCRRAISKSAHPRRDRGGSL